MENLVEWLIALLIGIILGIGFVALIHWVCSFDSDNS